MLTCWEFPCSQARCWVSAVMGWRIPDRRSEWNIYKAWPGTMTLWRLPLETANPLPCPRSSGRPYGRDGPILQLFLKPDCG
jgi:hypothetical protein